MQVVQKKFLKFADLKEGMVLARLNHQTDEIPQLPTDFVYALTHFDYGGGYAHLFEFNPHYDEFIVTRDRGYAPDIFDTFLWLEVDYKNKHLYPHSKKQSAVNSPTHYNKGKIEVIDYLVDQGWGEGFNRGNAVKYISRAGAKDPSKTIEDLEKAIWYINAEIKRLKEANGNAHN